MKEKMRRLGLRSLFWGALAFLPGLSPSLLNASVRPEDQPSDRYFREIDQLDALWSLYKYQFLDDGRVISPENGFSTSEAQGYAMLRSVWSGDRATFDRVWQWTRGHLQIRGDALFAWKWRDQVVDKNSAADADTDIALALILASRRFSDPIYREQARPILNDIWQKEILKINDRYFITAGDWAASEKFPVIHVGYLAPYAYRVFAGADPEHPWKKLVDGAYDLLHWIYSQEKLKLPPDIVYVDRRTGAVSIAHPETKRITVFSYEAVPLFWRVALDAKWSFYPEPRLRRQMLAFFQNEWATRGKFFDVYSLNGEPISQFEGQPLYAAVHSLALHQDGKLAEELRQEKLNSLWDGAMSQGQTPYYLHNWLWFDRALESGTARRYDEFLAFLTPFDAGGFWFHFAWKTFLTFIVLFFLAGRHRVFKLAFFACGFYLCLRYLTWRLLHTLNFIETLGPFISLGLWAAEVYCFSTVVLLLIQVGFGGDPKRENEVVDSSPFEPIVDIFIPICSEPDEILEKTLVAASHIRYSRKNICVLDDGHREGIRDLANHHNAQYILGPQKQSKAENLNHALSLTSGDLIAVFDTDHIPLVTFLEETVPRFSDPKIGFVQTPHHFYNVDIFQRAFGTSAETPSEQDMFHHAIQAGRDAWNGAFCTGTGTVFRRRALEQIRGFPLMSVTEDIHAGQKLHAAGWKSAFVNKDLAVGLEAESLSAYLVQRRRWMMGTLQIFFKDNPLFCRGLSFRQRLGYFASLYYFFFPLARCLLWVTPLYYLLFHLHPVLSGVSLLFANLIPFLVAPVLMTSVLLPGWPRILWADLNEWAVAAPLLRSMADLVLPKGSVFKVTPKGLTSHDRKFDWNSSKLTAIAVLITLAAIGKGVFEVITFGVETDAYFFNLAWASLTLFFLLISLLIAWEKGQRREESRVRAAFPFELLSSDGVHRNETHDISLSGISFTVGQEEDIAETGTILLKMEKEISCKVKQVYFERISRKVYRCGYEFMDLSQEGYCDLIKYVFASPRVWERSHARRIRNNIGMVFRFFKGIVFCLKPLKNRRRKTPRTDVFEWSHLSADSRQWPVLVTNRSAGGLQAVYFGNRVGNFQRFWIERSGNGSFEEVYIRPIAPFVWKLGFKKALHEGQPQMI